jgi:hypothetical protein
MNTKYAHATLAALAALTFLAIVNETANADPLPHQIPKFAQLPLNGEPNGGPPTILRPGSAPIFPVAPFAGHDELSTAYRVPTTDGTVAYNGTYMADDFADNFNTPVVHVQWWGSYLGQPTANPTPVQRFLISFENDVKAGPSPDNPLPFSHPGQPLLNQVVTLGAAPAPGAFQEAAIPTAAGSIDGQLYQYNAELAIPFDQVKGEIYWLKIVALDDHLANDPLAIQWGWHDRDYGIFDPLAAPVVPGERLIGPVGLPDVWHFQDDAVTGTVDIRPNPEGPPPLLVRQLDDWRPTNYIPGVDIPTFFPDNLSKDLAFVLYTIPEPGSLVLMGMSAAALLLFKRRLAR